MEFRTRPATTGDAGAIYRMIAAAELEWHGHAEVVPDGVAADLRRPLIKLDRDTLVVETPDGELVGWAWLHDGRRAQIDVRPSYRGQGIGTLLLEWAEERAREYGSPWIAQTVDDADVGGTALLRARGYEVLATNWLLERPTNSAAAAVPEGFRLGAFDAARAAEVYQLIEDAFGEFQQRRKSFEEWAELTISRATFLPDASTIAYAGDEVVGAVIALDGDEGYVEQLAVHRDHRRKGLARAMLDRTCTQFAHLSKPTCILWTHSATGALAMYEHLTMQVRRSTTVHRRPL